MALVMGARVPPTPLIRGSVLAAFMPQSGTPSLGAAGFLGHRGPPPKLLAMSLDSIVNIADLRAAAERRLPRAVFDYLDGTADDGITGRDNIGAFSEVRF